MSWDHVPPKGGINLSSVEIKSIFNNIAGKEDPNRLISQNGVKYRTICRDCNSYIGTNYDPIINEFNKTISLFLKSELILPKKVNITTKPIRLIKGILSHILTAKLNIDSVLTDQRIRTYLSSDNEKLPDEINIYYWIYPYDCTIIMRDFLVPTTPGIYSETTFCDMVKSFPVTFLVGRTPNFRNLDSLTKYKNLGIDDEVEMPVNLQKLHDYDFPERVDENNIVFMSAESQNGISAYPRK